MPTFSSFTTSNKPGAVDMDSSDEWTEQSAMVNMEERLREEFRLMMEATNKRLHALETRLNILEEKQDIKTSSSVDKSLEERVQTLEGILKKAEEAGKRRQQQRRSQSEDGLSTVTPEPRASSSSSSSRLRRSDSKLQVTGSDDAKKRPVTRQASVRGLRRSDESSSGQQVTRQASARGLMRSDSGKISAAMRINPN